MTVVYRLSPELRQRLKDPIGTLVRGSFSETMNRLEAMISTEKPPVLVSVGDTITRNLVRRDIKAKLMIVDNICMRRAVEEPMKVKMDGTVHVKNPPATITTEAIDAIQNALKGDAGVKIVVDGEEDLLVLIAVLHAPDGSFVLYGQPHEGIVVVRVTPEKKDEVAAILREMKTSSKS